MRYGLLSIFGLVLLAACSGRDARPASGVDAGMGPSALFDRYDHDRHDASIQRAGWTCLACHAIGARPSSDELSVLEPTSDDPDRTVLLPPDRICHACHAPDTGTGAPTRCRLCHDDDEGFPVPETHRAGWTEDHGRDAMATPDACYDCHESHRCVSCHFRRDRATTRVHPGTWLTLHGMAARHDPAGCDGCHEAGTCQQCHIDPTGRQGW